jgi:hypothetical protein
VLENYYRLVANSDWAFSAAANFPLTVLVLAFGDAAAHPVNIYCYRVLLPRIVASELHYFVCKNSLTFQMF